MQKVEDQGCCADQTNGQSNPIETLGEFVASSTCCNGVTLASDSQDQSDAALGFRVIARGYDLAVTKGGSSVVSLVHGSGSVSTGCCGSPSSESSFIGFNFEGEAGVEFFGTQPTDVDRLQGIDDLQLLVAVNDFGFNYEDVEEKISCCAVDQGKQNIVTSIGNGEGNDNAEFNCCNDSEVDPAGSRSVNLFIGHESKNTASKDFQVSSSNIKKGA